MLLNGYESLIPIDLFNQSDGVLAIHGWTNLMGLNFASYKPRTYDVHNLLAMPCDWTFEMIAMACNRSFNMLNILLANL